MTQVPQKPLVPNNTLLTKTPEEGRALAVMLARNSIHAMQGELETLKAGRAQYAHDPYGPVQVGGHFHDANDPKWTFSANCPPARRRCRCKAGMDPLPMAQDTDKRDGILALDQRSGHIFTMVSSGGGEDPNDRSPVRN
jgi:hypothetical protein